MASFLIWLGSHIIVAVIILAMVLWTIGFSIYASIRNRIIFHKAFGENEKWLRQYKKWAKKNNIKEPLS